ncbi:MAG TPA: type II secretion system F family protein [Planctomycetota bacterium]|nr:type II secretion system F family protein [Planctomycetota bacterium]
MAKFKYVARDPSGNQVTKTVEADSKEALITSLRKESLVPLSVNPIGGGGGGLNINWAALFNPTPKPSVKTKDLVVFTRQFSTMISSGIPVLECLDILEDQAEAPGFKLAIGQCGEAVRGGSDLSDAMAAYPKVFERIYVNMIKAGEASGQLDVILDRLAGFMESAAKLKAQIKSAMTYPVISLVMILLITTGLLLFVIPQFKVIFTSMNINLPLPTVIVLWISDTMQNQAWYILLTITTIVVTFILIKRTKKGAYYFDWFMLKVPVFGDLNKKVCLARFARTFSTLIRSGVPILGALEIVATTAGNRVLEETIDNAKDSIRQGNQLCDPLKKSPIFPSMVVRMIEIGERAGALEQLLEKIAEFYDDEVEATVETLTSLIEPLMIGTMGIIVGGIVLAVFLPIFKMQEALRNGG